MKYKELFTEGNGLFATYFYPDFGEEYQTIFARTPPEELDAVAVFKYGDRTLSEGLTAVTAAPRPVRGQGGPSPPRCLKASCSA